MYIFCLCAHVQRALRNSRILYFRLLYVAVCVAVLFLFAPLAVCFCASDNNMQVCPRISVHKRLYSYFFGPPVSRRTTVNADTEHLFAPLAISGLMLYTLLQITFQASILYVAILHNVLLFVCFLCTTCTEELFFLHLWQIVFAPRALFFLRLWQIVLAPLTICRSVHKSGFLSTNAD